MTAARTIAEVHREDVDRARRLLGRAIAEASAQWIPVNAIGDALVEELAALGRDADGSEQIASHLRRVASLIESLPHRLLS